MSGIRQVMKWVLPFAVSAAFLTFLLSRMDAGKVLDLVTPQVLSILVPTMLAFTAISLLIEAICLVRLVPVSRKVFGLMTAARVKSASYLLYIVNYALGAGALTLLLRRRAGMRLSDAGGIVLLLAAFDLGLLLLVTAVGAAWSEAETPGVLVGVIATAGVGMVGGLALLRSSRPLGPLERIRSMTLFRAARTSAPSLLLEIGLLRLVFVFNFIGLAWISLVAFDVSIPLGDVAVSFAIVALISTLPIAVAGLGTGQAAFVYMFRDWATEETLLACSLAFSAGLILLRAGLGFFFSQEFVREALKGERGTDADQTSFTGERLHEGSELFQVDLTRHRAAYRFAKGKAAGARVLDLGSGSGYGTAELANGTSSIVGVDRIVPDPSARQSSARWVRADLNGLPMASSCFDLIVSFQVIEHLADPTEYLRSIARFLAPGGTALITTPNRLTSDGENPYHVHEYLADELAECLSGHFHKVEMRGVGASPPVARYLDARLRGIRRITRLDPLRLRRRIPRGLAEWLFARFAVLVRRGIQAEDGLPDVSWRDFPINPVADSCIDLLAICSEPLTPDPA